MGICGVYLQENLSFIDKIFKIHHLLQLSRLVYFMKNNDNTMARNVSDEDI